MKSILYISALFLYASAAAAQPKNSTIEQFIADYESARESKTLASWRKENTHPLVSQDDSVWKAKWDKVEACHDKLHKNAQKVDKDALRPAYEKIKIKDVDESKLHFLLHYPVIPEKKIRLRYPKGSFIKGTSFYIAKHEGRWYRAQGRYNDEYIQKYLNKEKEHIWHETSPSCFE